MPNNLRQKTAGSPEPGLPALNLNAADGYENQLSATAEIINTSSAKGTATLTLKLKPSLFTCVNISTEISEFFDCIASAPLIDFGSTVLSSWAVAVLNTRTAFHPFQGILGENLIPPTTTFSFTNNQGNQPGPGFCARRARLFRVGHFTGNRLNLSRHS